MLLQSYFNDQLILGLLNVSTMKIRVHVASNENMTDLKHRWKKCFLLKYMFSECIICGFTHLIGFNVLYCRYKSILAKLVIPV
jgi:hypothetical protein